MVRLTLSACCTLGLALLLVGCTSSSVPLHTVKGKVLSEGKAPTVRPMVGKLRVWLVRVDVKERQDPAEAKVNESTGEFVVNGLEGKGIPSGKYKVCVTWHDEFPVGHENLQHRFDESKSSIVKDVPSTEEIIVEVGRPTPAPKQK
jgi:hypothetical protein